MKKTILSLAVITALSLNFIGCGSSSDGNNSGTSTDTTGQFIDAPVQGLKYKSYSTGGTLTHEGFTDKFGKFTYDQNGTVQFYLGNLLLGEVQAFKDIVSPYTLAGDTNISNPSDKAVNIARLFQSLDNNSSDSNYLTLPESLNDLDINDINLSSNTDAVLQGVLTKANTITSKTYQLKSAADSQNAMKSFVANFTNNLELQKANGGKLIILTNSNVMRYVGTADLTIDNIIVKSITNDTSSVGANVTTLFDYKKDYQYDDLSFPATITFADNNRYVNDVYENITQLTAGHSMSELSVLEFTYETNEGDMVVKLK